MDYDTQRLIVRSADFNLRHSHLADALPNLHKIIPLQVGELHISDYSLHIDDLAMKITARYMEDLCLDYGEQTAGDVLIESADHEEETLWWEYCEQRVTKIVECVVKGGYVGYEERIKQFPADGGSRSVFRTMIQEQLGTQTKPPIVVKLVVDNTRGYLRFPENFQMHVYNLEVRTNASNVLNALVPRLTRDSLPLQSLSIHVLDELDPAFRNEIVVNAKALTINFPPKQFDPIRRISRHPTWKNPFSHLKNDHLLVTGTSVPFVTFQRLLAQWKEDRRSIGTKFTVEIGNGYTAIDYAFSLRYALKAKSTDRRLISSIAPFDENSDVVLYSDSKGYSMEIVKKKDPELV